MTSLKPALRDLVPGKRDVVPLVAAGILATLTSPALALGAFANNALRIVVAAVVVTVACIFLLNIEWSLIDPQNQSGALFEAYFGRLQGAGWSYLVQACLLSHVTAFVAGVIARLVWDRGGLSDIRVQAAVLSAGCLLLGQEGLRQSENVYTAGMSREGGRVQSANIGFDVAHSIIN